MLSYADEVSISIGPELVCSERGGCYYATMKPSLLLDSVNVSDLFIEVVSDIGIKHFGKKPMFNNTRTTWWF